MSDETIEFEATETGIPINTTQYVTESRAASLTVHTPQPLTSQYSTVCYRESRCKSNCPYSATTYVTVQHSMLPRVVLQVQLSILRNHLRHSTAQYVTESRAASLTVHTPQPLTSQYSTVCYRESCCKSNCPYSTTTYVTVQHTTYVTVQHSVSPRVVLQVQLSILHSHLRHSTAQCVTESRAASLTVNTPQPLTSQYSTVCYRESRCKSNCPYSATTYVTVQHSMLPSRAASLTVHTPQPLTSQYSTVCYRESRCKSNCPYSATTYVTVQHSMLPRVALQV
ncbi:hypothetical protein J6590_079348 [Homalodisca vitripennis]|nr:hypothetical protein J6590_079348 [Homalodisca vitripennis]